MVTVNDHSPQQGMQRPPAPERLVPGKPPIATAEWKRGAGVDEETALREAVRNEEEATSDLIFRPDTTLLAVLGLFAELSVIKTHGGAQGVVLLLASLGKVDHPAQRLLLGLLRPLGRLALAALSPPCRAATTSASSG
jgi:hypothetical protein